MNPDITKTGILHGNLFLEQQPFYKATSSLSYTPAVDTNNSCLGSYAIDFSQFKDYHIPLTFHIELDLTWGDFSGSQNVSDFGIYFQGSNFNISSNSWAWNGSNYLVAGLREAANIKTLILNSITGGTQHVSATAVVPAIFFDTHSGSAISIRCNYRKGTGAVTISNLVIDLTQGDYASIHKNYISGRQFYEY